MIKVAKGDRVLLVGSHPWTGCNGEVVEEADAQGVLTVELDHGQRAMVWPGHYRVVSRGPLMEP